MASQPLSMAITLNPTDIEGHGPCLGLNDAALYLQMGGQYLRQIVREGEVLHGFKSEGDADGKGKGVWWIEVAALDAFKVTNADKSAVRAARKASGKKNVYKNQTPSYFRNAKSVRAAVDKLDFESLGKTVDFKGAKPEVAKAVVMGTLDALVALMGQKAAAARKRKETAEADKIQAAQEANEAKATQPAQAQA